MILRDKKCYYPYCTTPARSCDLDHVVPFDQGGQTCTSNLAPGARVIHFAAEPWVRSEMEARGADYRTADLNDKFELRLDITAIHEPPTGSNAAPTASEAPSRMPAVYAPVAKNAT